MPRFSLLTLSSVCLVLLMLVACGARDYRYVATGSAAGDDQSGVRAGATVVDAGQPGIHFSSVRRGGQDELLYLIVFQHDVANDTSWSAASQEEARVDPQGGQLTSSIKINSRAVRADCSFTRSPEGALVNGALTIDDRVVDPTLGRVFVVDMTRADSQLRQFDIALPALPAPETDATEVFAGRVIEVLRQRQPNLVELR